MPVTHQIPANWYDGQTAVRHEGEAVWDGRTDLELISPTSRIAAPLSGLQFGEERNETVLYRLHSDPDFRLILPKDVPAELARHLPEKREYGAWIDRFGLGKAAAVFALASAGAAALFITAPEWLGPRIPHSWERSIGRAMIGDLGGRLCHTPEGDAALQKLLDAVDPAQVQVSAGVANIDMVNAVALPGSQVLLFDGLVQQAESPEELAGVLAHEVGHVRERHVMTALLRQFGLSVLLAGSNSGLTDTVFGLASMNYSRKAEREADQFARRRMREADISPLGAAGFFERMAQRYGDEENDSGIIGWIATHPSSGERAQSYRNAADESANYRPALTDREFKALKSMCADDPEVEQFEFF